MTIWIYLLIGFVLSILCLVFSSLLVAKAPPFYELDYDDKAFIFVYSLINIIGWPILTPVFILGILFILCFALDIPSKLFDYLIEVFK